MFSPKNAYFMEIEIGNWKNLDFPIKKLVLEKKRCYSKIKKVKLEIGKILYYISSTFPLCKN